MSWRSLPDDVVEVVLFSLPLVELARVSTTCSTFQALYRRQIARKHEARCTLAVNYFGRERITSITGVIIQLLKGKPLESALDDYNFRGEVWGDDRVLTVSSRPYQPLPGDILSVEEHFPVWRALEVYVPLDRKGVEISVCPSDDVDDEMVALVQAILSGGLAQFIKVAGRWAQIDVLHFRRVPASLDMARRGLLKVHMGLLMQSAPQCISVKSIDVGRLPLRWGYLNWRLR